jgi:hypothetical protein
MLRSGIPGAAMGDFRRLEVWKAAHALAVEVYVRARDFPRAEQSSPLILEETRLRSMMAALIHGGTHRANAGHLSPPLNRQVSAVGR